MRWIISILLIMLILPTVSAWNTTIQFHPPHNQVLDDVILNYTSTCPEWVFGTFDNGVIVRDFVFFANESGSVDLQDYIYLQSPSNSTLYLESNCELNVTAYPRYGIYMHPPEIRAFSTEFRLVRMPFRRVGENQFVINTPWKLVAIYLESNTIYDNGTYVSRLPLEARVSWGNQSVLKTKIGEERPYWVDVSDEMPSGEVAVKLLGERAKYVSDVYGYAIVPHREDDQWWLLYNYKGGYFFGDGRLWKDIILRVEFLWKGESFALATFLTPEGKELKLRVKNGGICIGNFLTEKCSGSKLPKGALQLTIGFQNGYIWVLGDGTDYLDIYTGIEAVTLTHFLWGIPKKDRYSVEVHARDSVPWHPKRKKIDTPTLLSGSALLISLLAVLLARKR